MDTINCYVKNAQEAVDFVYDWFITKGNLPAFKKGEGCFSYDPQTPDLRCAVACLFPLSELLKYARPADHADEIICTNPAVLSDYINAMFGLSEYNPNPIQRVHDMAATDANRETFNKIGEFRLHFKRNLRGLCQLYELKYPEDTAN